MKKKIISIIIVMGIVAGIFFYTQITDVDIELTGIMFTEDNDTNFEEVSIHLKGISKYSNFFENKIEGEIEINEDTYSLTYADKGKYVLSHVKNRKTQTIGILQTCEDLSEMLIIYNSTNEHQDQIISAPAKNLQDAIKLYKRF